MSNYILTLQLKTEKFQEDIIYNAFNKYRKIYNSC
ncbi:transposase, partial [Clostridioides difficile]